MIDIENIFSIYAPKSIKNTNILYTRGNTISKNSAQTLTIKSKVGIQTMFFFYQLCFGQSSRFDF